MVSMECLCTVCTEPLSIEFNLTIISDIISTDLSASHRCCIIQRIQQSLYDLYTFLFSNSIMLFPSEESRSCGEEGERLLPVVDYLLCVCDYFYCNLLYSA